MDQLKRISKYILLIIITYVGTAIFIFIGFNVNYSSISLRGTLPEEISIEKAEATKSDGRIYGYVSNNRDNNVNGKYIKISVYDINKELLTTEYLKINDVSYGQRKLFKSKFSVKEAKSYSVSIVENENT